MLPFGDCEARTMCSDRGVDAHMCSSHACKDACNGEKAFDHFIIYPLAPRSYMNGCQDCKSVYADSIKKKQILM